MVLLFFSMPFPDIHVKLFKILKDFTTCFLMPPAPADIYASELLHGLPCNVVPQDQLQ